MIRWLTLLLLMVGCHGSEVALQLGRNFRSGGGSDSTYANTIDYSEGYDTLSDSSSGSSHTSDLGDETWVGIEFRFALSPQKVELVYPSGAPGLQHTLVLPPPAHVDEADGLGFGWGATGGGAGGLGGAALIYYLIQRRRNGNVEP